MAHPPPSGHGSVGEQPQDDAECDQPGETVGAQILHEGYDVAGDIAEERRLAYVGITRAQQTLALSFAAKRSQYGSTVDCEPSRFIAELPAEDLQWQGEGTQASPEEARARGLETLAGLKRLLG